jgi:beta-glucosidase-like glycosyl hydrolase
LGATFDRGRITTFQFLNFQTNQILTSEILISFLCSDLWEEIGTAIGNEGRAKYNYINSQGIRGKDYWGISFYAPNINIIRDPRWGRSQVL